MVAVSFMFSICTVSSYSPESERTAWRTKNTVSKSLVRTSTRAGSTGAPPFVHTTWGRGFPWAGGGERKDGGQRGQPGSLSLGPDPEPDPSLAHLEGDDQVEVLPHFADVSLAEVAREPDLGLLWGYRHRNAGSVLGWGTLERGTERQRRGRSGRGGGGPNDDMARAGQTQQLGL